MSVAENPFHFSRSRLVIFIVGGGVDLTPNYLFSRSPFYLCFSAEN